jgi:hypothetical protein
MNDTNEKRAFWIFAVVSFVLCFAAVTFGGDAGERFAIGLVALLTGLAIGRSIGFAIRGARERKE